MKKVRVALVAPALEPGGVETFLLRLARFLGGRGCAIDVVTTVSRGKWFDVLRSGGVNTVHIDGTSFTRLARFKKVGRLLRERHYDVVLLNNDRYAQGALAMLPDEVVAIPVVHNDVEGIYTVACANRRAWNVAVCVSPKVYREVTARVGGRPVVQILHGVECPDAVSYQNRRPAGNQIRVAFVGRLVHQHKGVFFLPEILKMLVGKGLNIHLAVLGEGSDAAALGHLFHRYGLAGRVSFRGLVDPAQVYGCLLDSHFLLMPSFFEGLPIVLLESMACGCVPIASRLPGITDATVTDGVTGRLIDVGDVEGFAEAIAAIAASPSSWTEMSQAAHARAIANFSVEAMGNRYLKLISDGLGGRYALPRSRRRQPPIDYSLVTWRDFVPLPAIKIARRLRQAVRSFASQPVVHRGGDIG